MFNKWFFRRNKKFSVVAFPYFHCKYSHQGWFQAPTDSEGGRKPTRWVPGTSARTDVAGTGWGAARWKGGRALFSQGPVPPPSHTWRLQASALFCPFTPKNSWLRQSWWRSWVHCTQTTHTHTQHFPTLQEGHWWIGVWGEDTPPWWFGRHPTKKGC